MVQHNLRFVDLKFNRLEADARLAYAQDKIDLRERFAALIMELKERRQIEKRALPDVPIHVGRNREDLTERNCAKCGGALALATIQNAKVLESLCCERWPEAKVSWQFKLAGLRHRNRKYCCYCCAQDDDFHSFDCVLVSNIEAAAKQLKIKLPKTPAPPAEPAAVPMVMSEWEMPELRLQK